MQEQAVLDRKNNIAVPTSTSLLFSDVFPARTYEGKTIGPDYIGSHVANLYEISYNHIDLDVLVKKTKEELASILGFDNNDIAGRDNEQIKKEFIIEQAIEKALASGKSLKYVGISYLSFQANLSMETIQIIHEVLKKKGKRDKNNLESYIPIIAGGRGTADAEKYVHLYPEVDIFVSGKEFHQPFDTMEALVPLFQTQDFFDDEKRNKIPGIVRYDQVGNLNKKTFADQAAKHDMDYYFENLRRDFYDPSYNFSIFNHENGKQRKTAQIYTQGGCSGACNFCSIARCSINMQRSVESIEKEIDSLIEDGYEAFYFDDSTFTENKSRALEIMQMLQKKHKKHGIVWGFNTRVDCLDEEVIQPAVESGCVYMFAGVEAMVAEVVEGFNKLKGKWQVRSKDYPPPVKTGEEYIERAKKVYQLMKKYNLPTSAFVIFGGRKKTSTGFEVESFDDVKKSIRVSIFDLEPDYFSFNILRFIPDAIMSQGEGYKMIRGEEKIDGGYYYNKYNTENTSMQQSHIIYEAFESAGGSYPIPPHMTPKYCYKILEEIVKAVNEYKQATGKLVVIQVDPSFEERFLSIGDDGYQLASWDEIDNYQKGQDTNICEKDTSKPGIITTFEKYKGQFASIAASLLLVLGIYSLFNSGMPLTGEQKKRLHDMALQKYKNHETLQKEYTYVMSLKDGYPTYTPALDKLYVGLAEKEQQYIISLLADAIQKNISSKGTVKVLNIEYTYQELYTGLSQFGVLLPEVQKLFDKYFG